MLKKFDSIQKILSQVKNFELADRIGKHKWRGQHVSKKAGNVIYGWYLLVCPANEHDP